MSPDDPSKKRLVVTFEGNGIEEGVVLARVYHGRDITGEIRLNPRLARQAATQLLQCASYVDGQ